MDTILRDGTLQLQNIAAKAFAGDSHFFEDLAAPEKIKDDLASNLVSNHQEWYRFTV